MSRSRLATGTREAAGHAAALGAARREADEALAALRDTEETAEWAASLDAVAKAAGTRRAEYLLRRTYKVQKGDNILVHAAAGGVGGDAGLI